MTIHIYPSGKREWRWRLISKGRIVAIGGESYKRKASIYRFLRRIFNGDQPRAYVKFWELDKNIPVKRVKKR